MQKCVECQKSFSTPQMELDYLKERDLPEPKKCPTCRRIRRFAFRNERRLYHRKCDLTGKQIISIYAPSSQYKVYDQHEWHSDKWDAFDYGRDFDFNRPFFEQFNELVLDVPKLSVFTSRNENSDYTNGAQQDRNCYMLFVSDHDEDCLYSYAIDSCKDCLDCLNCYKCELCLECIDCSESYNLAFCEQAHNCSDSYFLNDCKGCQNCFGCFGLRNKKFHIFNEPYSKEDYDKKVKSFETGNREQLEQFRQWFDSKIKEKQINQYYDGNSNHEVTGDHIVRSKNCVECYDSGELEDCAYLIFSFKSKNCFDGHVVVDKSELCYETISTVSQYNTQFTFVGFYSKNCMYIDHCHSCKDCFGCSGLKSAQYCIFNKQYSKEEYEQLRTKIIEHMKKTEEWGQAMPTKHSLFGYNETVAQEFYPLTKEEALNRGYKWQDEEDKNFAYQGPQVEVPKNIEDVKDDIIDKILICRKSGKPFKITPQELRSYRFHKLPLPELSFEERHLARLNKRNPREVWERDCMKCGKKLESSFSPDRPEKVYCEECYLKEIH